jgi:D-xylose transport system substrate-binding protein
MPRWMHAGLLSKEGQTMSVYKSIKGLAYQAIDIAVDVAKGKKITEVNRIVNNGRKEVPAILLLTPKVVDKDNMMATVVADGVFTREQIYD